MRGTKASAANMTKQVKVGDFCPVWPWNVTDDLVTLVITPENGMIMLIVKKGMTDWQRQKKTLFELLGRS